MVRSICLVLALMFCSLLTAQTPAKSGKVYIHIVDSSSGAVIGDAIIFVRHNMPSEEGFERAGHTAVNGNFILSLSPGAYDIVVAAPGFESKIRTVLIKPDAVIKDSWTLALSKDFCQFPDVNCDTFR